MPRKKTTGTTEDTADDATRSAPASGPDTPPKRRGAGKHAVARPGNEPKEPDACCEMNEGLPTKPLPKEGLPQMPDITPPDDDATKADAKHAKKRRDGMKEALEILDEYYKDTPTRDKRFHHDEE